MEIGIARAVGAVAFSVIIGLLMHLIFRKEEIAKVNAQMAMPEPEVKRPLWQTTVYFALMVAILVFANWGKPDMQEGFFYAVHSIKWYLTGISAAAFAVILVLWFNLAWSKIVYAAVPTVVLAFLFPHEPLIPFGAAVIGLSAITSKDTGEAGEWFSATWGFAKQITPLLLGGVLVSGLLLGRPGNEGIIPNAWVTNLSAAIPCGQIFLLPLSAPLCILPRSLKCLSCKGLSVAVWEKVLLFRYYLLALHYHCPA